MKLLIQFLTFILFFSLTSCVGVEELIEDTDSPDNASSMNWIEINPAVDTSTNVTASWVPSLSGDLDTQIISFYSCNLYNFKRYY